MSRTDAGLWAGDALAPGYDFTRNWAVIAPDLDLVADWPRTRLEAITAAQTHWRKLTPGGQQTIAKTGLRVLQRKIERGALERDLRAAALLVLHLEPETSQRTFFADIADGRWDFNDGARAVVLSAARRLAPRVGYASDRRTARERLTIYLDAFHQLAPGQPRWYLTPEAWRDLASIAGGLALAWGPARLGELAERVSPDGERVAMSASEIDELCTTLRRQVEYPACSGEGDDLVDRRLLAQAIVSDGAIDWAGAIVSENGAMSMCSKNTTGHLKAEVGRLYRLIDRRRAHK